MEDIMWDGVRRRIIERLAELDMTAGDVSKKIGRTPGYLYEFIGKPKGNGRRGRRSKEEAIAAFGEDGAIPPKKSSIRDEGLRQIAEALDCDVEFLYGIQDDPRGSPIPPCLPLAGLLVSGMAMSPGKQGLPVKIPTKVRALEQYPVEIQKLYYVQDDHAADLCLPTGSMVIAIPADAAGRDLRDDDLVIAGTWQGPMVELTAQRARGSADDSHPSPDFEIMGLIVFAARYTG